MRHEILGRSSEVVKDSTFFYLVTLLEGVLPPFCRLDVGEVVNRPSTPPPLLNSLRVSLIFLFSSRPPPPPPANLSSTFVSMLLCATIPVDKKVSNSSFALTAIPFVRSLCQSLSAQARGCLGLLPSLRIFGSRAVLDLLHIWPDFFRRRPFLRVPFLLRKRDLFSAPDCRMAPLPPCNLQFLCQPLCELIGFVSQIDSDFSLFSKVKIFFHREDQACP